MGRFTAHAQQYVTRQAGRPMTPLLSDRHTAEQQNPSNKPLQHSSGMLHGCVVHVFLCVCRHVCVCVCIRGDGISPETVHLGVFMHV